MTNETHIVIADDHPVFRQGLRQLIESDAQFKVVDEAADGEAALAKLVASRPQIAVLDIDMPKLNGFGLARAIRAQHLPTEVIFLTMYKEEEFFNEAMDLGVKGYLLKDSAVTDILACIRAVTAGQYYITPAISAYLLNRQTRTVALTKQWPGLNDLTPTERRIIKMIAEHKTSKEIAAELFVSYRTIENHRANICQKLELRGSHVLIKFALEHKSQLT